MIAVIVVGLVPLPTAGFAFVFAGLAVVANPTPGALDRIGTSELDLVSYLVPVVAALVGRIVLGDVHRLRAVTGFAVVFVGFALLERDVLCRVVRIHSAVPDCRDAECDLAYAYSTVETS
jgi:drug/metabolite transporter (DMT)-like permease